MYVCSVCACVAVRACKMCVCVCVYSVCVCVCARVHNILPHRDASHASSALTPLYVALTRCALTPTEAGLSVREASFRAAAAA